MTPSLPLFYASPRPLDRARDGALRIAPPAHYHFAAKTNAIPLLLNEFALAAPHYPIVFAGEDLPLPAVMVGNKDFENLFVSADGKWSEGAYIPAYVRRYPFILMGDNENKQFIFCFDEKSEMLGGAEGIPLFNGDKPSDFTQNAMKFCADLQQQGDSVNEFVAALREHKMLVRSDVKMEASGGTILKLAGLWAIDAQKFEALPDNVYLAWRRKGWIAPIYAHLMSLQRWPHLMALTAARAAETSDKEALP